MDKEIQNMDKEEGILADIKEWDPLDTPQIATSWEAQRRLARGVKMPGLYEVDHAKTEDGEEPMTIDERLASIQKNMKLIREEMME
jgi:hypothetical protein